MPVGETSQWPEIGRTGVGRPRRDRADSVPPVRLVGLTVSEATGGGPSIATGCYWLCLPLLLLPPEWVLAEPPPDEVLLLTGA